MKSFVNKYIKYGVLFILSILLSTSQLQLNSHSLLPSDIIIGQSVLADEGNALPYEPGVSLPVTRTGGPTDPDGHGYEAIDFRTDGRTGINARASRSGTVILNETQNTGSFINGIPCGFGHVVHIAYNNGDLGIYAHLARRSTLRIGQLIRQGDIVGEIGTTGCSTGIHLHYERQRQHFFNRATAYLPIFKEYPNSLIREGGVYTSQNTGQPATLEAAIQGRVSIHRGGNSELYVSWDKNTGAWQHPPAKITGPYGPSQTAHSPVAVYDKYGKLNVFHVGINGEVYQQILSGNTWQTINTRLITSTQPEVVLHEGYLNIYARGPQSQLLHVSSGDNRNWGQVRTIPTSYPVYGKPSAAVRGREILVAYPTENNQIATHYSATGQGYTNRLVPGLRTRREIGLVSYNGRFVMVHVGDNGKGYLNFTENVVGWSSARQVPYSTFTIGIDMNVSNNLIHLSHGGGDGQIYYQTTNTHDGGGWSYPQRQHYLHTSPNPITLTGK